MTGVQTCALPICLFLLFCRVLHPLGKVLFLIHGDFQNPYFAPYLEENLEDQPDTLILTAEFDPLRDEGEAYGNRLEEAGNQVEMHRIKDALHGYFALGVRHQAVRESLEYIKVFLRRDDSESEKGTLEKA